MADYRDVLKKVVEEKKRIWLEPPIYVEEIRRSGFSNVIFARTIAYLVANSLGRLMKSIEEDILPFEYAKKFSSWSFEEFAKMFEGHMFIFKYLKPELENIPCQLFREAALAISKINNCNELLDFLEEFRSYSTKLYDWIDWSITWFNLEKTLKNPENARYF
jgi:hypothetical protein